MIAAITTDLDTPAPTAWTIAKRKDTLTFVTRGVLGFDGLGTAAETWSAGEELRIRLVAFHAIPLWQHRLRIVRIDDERREIASAEAGGPVRRWNHIIRIEPNGSARCRYSDIIDIDAGGLTLVVWLVAHAFYRYRQRRWRTLVASVAPHASATKRD